MASCSRSKTLFSRFRRLRNIAFVALCASVWMTTACFGSFPLTRVVYKTNKDIADVEFHQTLAYWAMMITLVYPGAVLTDAIVMNTIEFWAPQSSGWQGSSAYIPVPSNRYEKMNPADGDTAAPSGLSGALAIPAPPVAPASQSPGFVAPGSPSVPLPLTAQPPVFEESKSGDPGHTMALSQAWGPAAAH